MTRRRRPAASDPFALWATGMEVGRLALEAQAVMTMRMLGMAGLWAVAPSENARMMAEKGPAFAKAGAAAARAIAAGRSPEAVVSAAAKPLSRVTRANVGRLGRKGPAKPRRRK